MNDPAIRKPRELVDDVYSECVSKKRYSDEKFAAKIARQILADRGVKLRAYGCFHCGGAHLTRRLQP